MCIGYPYRLTVFILGGFIMLLFITNTSCRKHKMVIAPGFNKMYGTEYTIQACPPSKYRSASGECNNILHMNWGSSGEQLLRLLPNSYADSTKRYRSLPRVSSNRTLLPEPEQLVQHLQQTNDLNVDHPHVTAMLPAWGLLLSYDMINLKMFQSNFKCCKQNSSTVNPSCYVYAGKNCKEYKRTISSDIIEDHEKDHRQQINEASSYIDGSGLYGVSKTNQNELRTNKNGRVMIDKCSRCLDFGVVGALHRAMLEEHNRIVEILFTMNPNWSDEKLFLEGRRIIVAQIQHITFNEFLPVVLGQELSSVEDLRLIHGNFFKAYSSANKAGILNEFAIAATPAFLTMLPIDMLNKTLASESLINKPAIKKNFIHPYFGDEANWSAIGLAIHRGRDHGLPSYLETIGICNLNYSKDYKTLTGNEPLTIMSSIEGSISLLEHLYSTAEDIDLIVGALLENPNLGSVFGPTFTCLMAMQFALLRKSDRFWYENDIPPSSLTLNQLQSIRRVTLSGILCASSAILKAQPKAFIREDSYLNAQQPCNQLPAIDLSYWKQEFDFHPENDKLYQLAEELVELNTDIIKEAVEKAKKNLIKRKKFEYDSWLKNGGIDATSPDGTAASFSKANKNALVIANSSLIYELTSNEILNTLNKINRKKRQILDNNLNVFTRDEFTETLQTIDITSFLTEEINSGDLDSQCEDFMAPCDTTTPFRSHTGRCNNLQNPNWGRSLTVFSRLLPANYNDGVSQTRHLSVSGAHLPNPRVVSTLIHPDISNLHTRYSLMIMQYAQFLDHDLTMTPIHKGFHESIPSCRKCDSAKTVHPECSPFPVPTGDHYYPEVNVTSGERLCFPFMRSLPGQQNLGPREQINQNTAFLDGSQIYGENACVSRKLKGFAGRMNSTLHPIKGKELLPQSPAHPECKSRSGYCFIAGDDRASEQPGLTALHTVFMREHNRIVEGLRNVNPHWNEHQLYEHARRIVIAENQHLTYNEFLPRILSWNAVNLYGLKLLPQGYYKEYNPSCNPTILNEFASAAFRIGHSLLRPHIPRLSPNHKPIDPPLLLRDAFFKTDVLLQPLIIDEIIRGLVATPMEALDQFITGEVTNHLFEDRRVPFSGIDLIALNIQRGRDHGLPSYNNYRALCNLKRAHVWDDFSREIPREVINRFKKIYLSVDDVDLFTGAMTERPLQGGLVGPTLACIIGIQFRQLRKCDRFWYETNDPVIRFTELQLTELRKTTLAKILCNNLEVSGDMQRAAFDLPSNFLNSRIPCNSMPQIDLSFWKENIQGCRIGNRQVQLGESALPSPCTSCVCSMEGAQCASLRITDCIQLSREWSRDAILRDDVCNAQCGLLLQIGNNIAGLSPPPARVSRSRTANGFSFKFPDLSSFIPSF